MEIRGSGFFWICGLIEVAEGFADALGDFRILVGLGGFREVFAVLGKEGGKAFAGFLAGREFLGSEGGNNGVADGGCFRGVPLARYESGKPGLAQGGGDFRKTFRAGEDEHRVGGGIGCFPRLANKAGRREGAGFHVRHGSGGDCPDSAAFDGPAFAGVAPVVDLVWIVVETSGKGKGHVGIGVAGGEPDAVGGIEVLPSPFPVAEFLDKSEVAEGGGGRLEWESAETYLVGKILPNAGEVGKRGFEQRGAALDGGLPCIGPVGIPDPVPVAEDDEFQADEDAVMLGEPCDRQGQLIIGFELAQ